ncbi:hypothetical protein [Nocardioides anomalus]|uniref:hypothetical protein n=1 Tax=Nocardioides anomalus TaxID=2712223 RepID=UPI001E47EE10|nr:hypothetical protein [Nocardioides anomalus]
MRTFWKVFAALALMLPLGAFVAGTLVASAADEPAERDTIVIRDGAASTSPTPEPEDDTPGVDTVTPSPDEVHDAGDDHGGDRPDDQSDDQSDDSSGGGHGSGHGSGSDDPSGHGSGHSGSGSGKGGGDDHSGHGGGDD